MMSADVTHFYLKDPSPTTMAVPSRIALAMCLSAASVVVWGFLQVDS